MLGKILIDLEHYITLKSKCERPEIQDVNVFNNITFKDLLKYCTTFKLLSKNELDQK